MTEDYGKQVFEIMGKIHRITHLAKPVLKISKGEFMMLTHIEMIMEKQKKEKDMALGVSVTQINKLSKASRPATSKMLNSLEDKNYIQRTVFKKDKRVVYIRMTEEGSRVLEETKAQFGQFAENIFLKLGEKDATELIRIFNKLYQILSEEYTK
ncbi:MarR family protein [Mobilisporobacter senegalensis]|uniref:MarR family protein n=1 Tax=Mobilisporobacter senegalensis TaxID=1329262 RepID=A0A3N1XV76_9FIRM|nr:MarR family transcriptional regulator [Mobilisporobacter senegalensis]ROR30513.1 MarR family protein [Mobilisporobacter senegalensis]